ncbi:MAG TPA: MFS transporter [Candidatus Binatia bacterium]|jgi:MFS family permease|nr:MFS transporter [Candidatus Binatia bacterium]
MEEQRGGFFYGWVIVFAGLILSLIMFGVVDSFGVMFKPISEQFSWDRGTISVASMMNWISFGVATLLFGALSDRFGSRRIMILGGLIFVAGTLLLSQIQSLWQLYLYFGILLAIGRAAAGVPLMALVTKWFVRNQGLALALAQSQNVGPAVFAPLSVFLLAHYGWRGAYLWLGVGALLIIPMALLMRDHSTSRVPGRSLPSGGVSHLTSHTPLAGVTLSEAVRTRAFWTLNLMVLGCCTCHSCILLHGINHMTDVGLPAATAAQVSATMAICGMIGKIANGLLADRIGAKWAIAGFLGLQALMLPLFIEAHTVPTFFTWAVLFGLGYGGPMPVYAMLFREYFGTRSIGTILGVFFMIASLGMGLGGLMGGVMYNHFGSYALPFLTSTGTGLISALLALTLPSSKKREVTVTPQMVLQPS